ncbi:hypothetical protein Glove_66g19 [Diversispora epigaea]|uniref:Uncharacterized protein n=1 Tax=Diversispora epigaea TaxID=1348612 RepID=A0A397JBH8_9GLOM|nr:hypothetical protein Glove_66g19 [Diversispora epigaea]
MAEEEAPSLAYFCAVIAPNPAIASSVSSAVRGCCYRSGFYNHQMNLNPTPSDKKWEEDNNNNSNKGH